ncbi:hypothetical protein IYV58_27715 (plasmid) [Klebsiella sp. BDA134-6]|uniref:hypothetical protein n=1 Tax=Klebsiella sp. BDA134-6 TaxID=2787706 RepID=UPI00189D99EB|nr:hypothetical protein [Klebsiella sp. BDA134-6]QPF30602.1 hypothetical protein IYV58_27715 [Klebsiella sp. BDA134-6]
MKFNKKNFITVIFFLLLAAFPFLKYLHGEYKKSHFACLANYSAINNDNVFVSNNSLIINGENGTWMMDGKISYPNSEPLFFKLRNNFSVERTKFSYHFHSKRVSIIPSETSYGPKLSEFLADVIINENKDSFFYIYPAGEDYLIYSGAMPIMYCMKKDN